MHRKHLDARQLSVIVFSLFSCWQLAFPFEGRILYAFAQRHHIDARQLVFFAIVSVFVGLFSCGFFIRNLLSAKRFILFSIAVCFIGSVVFFYPPSAYHKIVLTLMGLLTGGTVAAWGFCLRHTTVKSQRFVTIADGLIASNVLMILLTVVTVCLSFQAGLTGAMFMLALSFAFALKLFSLIEREKPLESTCENNGAPAIGKPLIFLSLFIVVITINSGLMYQVVVPAFAHLQTLTSWYWAIPYIAALWVMRNLSAAVNRSYILYFAMSLIGFSFLCFFLLDRSAVSYLVIDTLMLAAFGVYDLFWWGILGDMLETDDNPAKILGLGLSANVLGIFIGGLTGSVLGMNTELSVFIALAVICITLAILPPLYNLLAITLKEEVFSLPVSLPSLPDSVGVLPECHMMEKFTHREHEVAQMLLARKTYGEISRELFISANTVKSHVRNVYAKAGVQNRTQLIGLFLKNEPAGGP